jgi:hypothetical protein
VALLSYINFDGTNKLKKSALLSRVEILLTLLTVSNNDDFFPYGNPATSFFYLDSSTV